MKNYIVTKDVVQDLASTVVYQDGLLHLEKRQGTEFYTAITDDKIKIPISESILEIEPTEEQFKRLRLAISNEGNSEDGYVDLIIRLKLTDDIDPRFINEKVIPAIQSGVEKVIIDKYKNDSDD